MEGIKKALVLAPHPDDGEFGCGGTLNKLVESGVEVYYAAFSPCVKSVPKDFEKDILYKELSNAVQELGIPEDNLFTYNFEVRNFKRERQLILEDLVQLKKEIQPDLVLIPNSDDIHQDHQVIHEEGVRAFKQKKILGYELPWNNYHMKTNFHVMLNESHVQKKVKAVQCYQSQQFRNYADNDFIRSLAIVRGTQGGGDFAEAFELIHWIG